MGTKLSSNHLGIIKILPSGFASSLEGEQKWPIKIIVIKKQEIKEPSSVLPISVMTDNIPT